MGWHPQVKRPDLVRLNLPGMPRTERRSNVVRQLRTYVPDEQCTSMTTSGGAIQVLQGVDIDLRGASSTSSPSRAIS